MCNKKMISAYAEADDGRIVSEVIQVHHCIGQQNLMVLVCLRRKLNAEFASPRSPLQKDPIVNVDDPANFQLQVIEDVILDGRTITASEARAQYALLAVIALDRVEQLVVFPHHLYLRISTAVIRTSHEPATHSQCPQQSTSRICMAYTRGSIFIVTDLLALPYSSCHVLPEKLQLRFKGAIAYAETSRKAIRCLLQIALLAGHVEVRICLRQRELIGRLTETAEGALQAIVLLIEQIVSSLELARAYISLPSQLLPALLLCHVVTKMKLQQIHPSFHLPAPLLIWNSNSSSTFLPLSLWIVMMESPKMTIRPFLPLQLKETSTLTPDHPDFRQLDINLAILTKYGRGVYIRHGNQDRCSSFFATLGTIVNKLQLSFGKGENSPARLKCIRQGDMHLYVIRRLNFMYICWSKRTQAEMTLYVMMELVHHQLMSCLTGKVNAILENNQTYDPAVNFGKNRTEHLLLHYAFQNGLTSLPVLMNAVPVLPLPPQTRSAIYNLLRDEKIQGLQVNILMSMHAVIQVHKQKGVDFTAADTFLFNTLIQSQSSLRSEIWYPICLPGVFLEDRVFCYINFLTDYVIHIMVSDEASIFQELSKASRDLREKCIQQGIFEQIHTAAQRQLSSEPAIQKMGALKHFAFRQLSDQHGLPQMLMSHGNYFGQNQREFSTYLHIYAELQRLLLTRQQTKREKLLIQPIKEYMAGYQEENGFAIFFICSTLAEIDDCRMVVQALSRYAKDNEGTLWISRFT